MEEITLELDDEHFHFVLRQYGLEGAKKMAINMALAQYKERPLTAAISTVVLPIWKAILPQCLVDQQKKMARYRKKMSFHH
jgi:hypothetical protein